MSNGKREGKVFHRLKDRVCNPQDRFDRVENGLGTGWPDVNYCIMGSEGWIELKAPEEPVHPSTPLFGTRQHNVTIEQGNWMIRQHNAGGCSWLFVATLKRLMLLPGKVVGELGREVNQLTAHQLKTWSAWYVELPMLDPLRWADLRELLAWNGKVPKK